MLCWDEYVKFIFGWIALSLSKYFIVTFLIGFKFRFKTYNTVWMPDG